MPSTRRTAAEQREWDRLFRDFLVECVRREGIKRAMGCLSLAQDFADQALAKRRKSQQEKAQ